MKKLIAFTVCFMVAVSAYAQQKQTFFQRVTANTQRQLQAAQRANQPVKIPGEKRLVKVRLELQESEDNREFFHRYWSCPAVIFNKDGALAFDGECWEAIKEAADLPVGPVVHFLVDLGKFGEYTIGEEFGQPFYFRSTYVAVGEGDEYTRSVDEAFKLSADKSYIVYKLSLFNDPKNENNSDNSEAKRAIANYYQQNNLREVTAETLSKYFKQKHPTKSEEITRF